MLRAPNTKQNDPTAVADNTYYAQLGRSIGEHR